MPAPQRFDDLFVYETEILHQGKKPGLLAIAKAENLDFSLRNQVSEVLLRMVQDLSEMKKCYI